MLGIIFGTLIGIMGFYLMAIPIFGWIIGPILMITGFIMFISGISGNSSSDDTQVVYHDFDHPLNEKRRQAQKAEMNMYDLKEKVAKTETQNMKVEQLNKYIEMLNNGHITQEEFEKLKKELI